MSVWSVLTATPSSLWWPLLLALVLLVTLVIVSLRPGNERALARRVATQVALRMGVGYALLVLGTASVVFYTGLVNLAVPTQDDLAMLAADIERVRTTTREDEPSLRGRLALLDAVNTKTSWAMIGRLGCAETDCVMAVSPRLSATDGMRLHRMAIARPDGQAWAATVGGRVAKVVPVPLRDVRGVPDAQLLIGFDADDVVQQAVVATWTILGALLLLWVITVVGTQRVVALLVSDRLRTLADSLAGRPGAETVPPAERDELKTLAAAVESVADRSVRQQTQFRTIVDLAPVGIVRVDSHGRIITCNPRFRKLLALGTEEPTLSWEATFLVPEELARFRQALTSSDALSSVFWTWRDTAGGTRSVEVSSVPLPTEDGAPGALLLCEDVTEQRALELQLQRSQKMELVGRLAGGIAHDFNNLLTVVRGNVSAMGGVTVSPELGAIDDAAARGARLVRRLLTISRNDLLTLAPVQPGPLLHDVIEMVRRVLPARITVEAPVQVPDITLMIDRDAIEQSLLNLALNARDAMPGPGLLRFDAREVRSPSGAHALVVAVVDNGAGMPADVLARATEPFFSTKPPDRGTGLGLSVVSSIMERMGGRLELRSAPGRGTRAELWFPVTPPSDAEAPQNATGPGDRERRTPLHILLVDDEHAVRVATERALRSSGHDVATASNMQEALSLLDGPDRFDLVVSDVMMPGGSGTDLLRTARATGHTLPFLFVSGYAMESLEGILEADRRTGMLTKPWSTADLERKVRETAAA